MVELRAVGVTQLLLSGLAVRRSELERFSQAVPSAAVTVVRLQAPLEVLEQRIRGRELASPDRELEGARWWTHHFKTEQLEDYLVESDQRPVREIAREALRLSGWLS